MISSDDVLRVGELFYVAFLFGLRNLNQLCFNSEDESLLESVIVFGLVDKCR